MSQRLTMLGVARFTLMSTTLAVALAASSTSTAHALADEYDVWRIDTGVSAAFAPGPGAWGIGAFFEPKLNVLNQLSVGLRLDGAAMFGGSIGTEGEGPSVSVDTLAVASFLAKAEYYLTTSAVRPYVGFGLGLYHLGGQDVSTSTGSVSIDQRAGAHFGIAPQIGINFGAFRLGLTYNVLVAASTEVRQTVTIGMAPEVENISQNYLTIEIGGTFGGKPRPPAKPEQPLPGKPPPATDAAAAPPNAAPAAPAASPSATPAPESAAPSQQ